MLLNKKILLLLILSTTIAFAQNEDKKPETSILTLGLLAPTYFYAPRWNVGYIRKIDRRIWVGLELGYGDFGSAIGTASGDNDVIFKKYKLYEIRPELYYDLSPSSKVQHLLSAELFYIHHSDVFKDNWYRNDAANLQYTFESADYQRHKYGININYSLFLNITKRLAVMPKIGFGIKHRNVQFSNVVNQQQSNAELEEGNWILSSNDYRKNEGNLTNLNFNLDIKIVYRLN